MDRMISIGSSAGNNDADNPQKFPICSNEKPVAGSNAIAVKGRKEKTNGIEN